MKTLYIFLFNIIWVFCIYGSDTLTLSPEIKDVTLFLKGAQLAKKGTVNLKKGDNIIVFKGISPYVDENSIQLQLSNNVTLLSISSQMDLDKWMSMDQEKIETQAKIDSCTQAESILNLEKTINAEKLEFLKENRKILSQTHELSVQEWKDADAFHDTRLTELIKNNHRIAEALAKLNARRVALSQKLASLGGKPAEIFKKITCVVSSEIAANIEFELRYFTEGATWVPSYDFRLDKVGEPIHGIYRGMISQQTKEDWKNVKLTLSTSNPSISHTVPELITYNLDYYLNAPNYNKDRPVGRNITGYVYDENGEALIGANIIAKGTTIGAITDFDGKYVLSIPSTCREVEISYLGYETTTLPANNIPNPIVLKEGGLLNEVVVTAYSIERDNKSIGYATTKIKSDKYTNIQKNVIKAGINSFTYGIDKPYTILSNMAPVAVQILEEDIQAEYEMVTIPKIEEAVFVNAHISDLFDNQVLDGQAMLFFENNYIGKTTIEAQSLEDSLSLSFGRDKNVIVSRDLIKSNSQKKFLSQKRIVTKEYHIKLKNRKQESINILVKDQIPVSQNSEIKVEIKELSSANIDDKTGMVDWKISLKPNEEKLLILKYEVSYPKDKRLVVE